MLRGAVEYALCRTMRLRDSVIISANATTVWPYLADPVRWADWNEKVISIGRDRSGPVRLGERFQIIGRVPGSGDREATVEASVVEQPYRATFIFRAIWRDRPQVFEEAYVISVHRLGAKVVKSVGLAGAPYWTRVLFWAFNRFGTPAGPVPLDELKKLVERSARAA